MSQADELLAKDHERHVRVLSRAEVGLLLASRSCLSASESSEAEEEVGSSARCDG